ncbi:zinc finger protein 586-like isoform X2 [Pleurodeles waltl]|uniref:zinc finger protein 586-like isoform X2 n=1 Tax=Pleurodeles waltl TaxID=8319 RepID=UPI0037093FC5
MPLQGSAEMQVTLHETAAYFSEEEWKLLHEWQKELYNNVMKEIHQALLSLGPLIATTVFSLRAKEKDDQCGADSLAAGRTHIDNRSPGDVTGNSADSFWIKGEAPQYLKDRQDTDRRGNSDYPSPDCYPAPHPEIVIPIQEEEKIQCSDWDALDGSEIHSRPTKGYSLLSADICQREVPASKPFLMDSTQEGGHEVISFIIKEEEEATCSLERQTSIKRGTINCSTGRHEPINCTEPQPPRTWEKTLIYNKEDVSNIGHRSGVIGNQRIHQGRKPYVCSKNGSSVNHRSNHFKHLGSQRGQRLSNVTGYGKNIHESLNVGQSQDLQTVVKVCVCSRCGICFNQSTDVNSNQQTSSDRQKTCSDCMKSFRLSLNVKEDQRKLMAQRAHMCSECGKSFKTSQLLVRHWRIHTGEKPYTCVTCGKSFRQTAHLIRHQRMHMREKLKC